MEGKTALPNVLPPLYQCPWLLLKHTCAGLLLMCTSLLFFKLGLLSKSLSLCSLLLTLCFVGLNNLALSLLLLTMPLVNCLLGSILQKAQIGRRQQTQMLS